ncbi:MAG: hypothetical protein ACREP0_14570 [Rhodanobacteraceae bacterium]
MQHKLTTVQHSFTLLHEKQYFASLLVMIRNVVLQRKLDERAACRRPAARARQAPQRRGCREAATIRTGSRLEPGIILAAIAREW